MRTEARLLVCEMTSSSSTSMCVRSTDPAEKELTTCLVAQSIITIPLFSCSVTTRRLSSLIATNSGSGSMP